METTEERARRERLRELFDDVAEDYEAGRATYPDALVSRVMSVGGLNGGSSVLEVGCGTGQLTRQLVRHGLSVVAIDPGRSMVRLARRRVSSVRARFAVATFEDFDAGGRSFDLVVSAAAWHWVDPAVGWEKAASLLRRGGWLALIDNSQEYDEPVAGTLRELIERVTDWKPPLPDSARDAREEWLASAPKWFGRNPRPELFGDVAADVVVEQTSLTAEQLVFREGTRAGFLSLDMHTRVSFVRDLRASLESTPRVGLTQFSYLAMAPVLVD